MNYKIYQNGKEVSGELAVRFLRDEGAGIFESMRAYRGKILHEDEHLARLLESAKTVGYRPVPELADLRQEIKAALKTFQGDSPSQGVCDEGRIRPTPCGGKGTVPVKDIFVRLTLWEGETFVILGRREHPKALYEKGVALKTASFSRGGPNTFPWQIKVSAYQQAILASTEPHPDKIYEWLFLDRQGFLTESRIGNFFLVKHPYKHRVFVKTNTRCLQGERAVLLTPPEHGILNGVTRRFVIKCALELGIKVHEVPLTRHEFFNADEVFLCNTSWEVLPVRELDGRIIGAGKPGPVTSKLHRYFIRRVHQDVTPYRSPRAHQRFR